MEIRCRLKKSAIGGSSVTLVPTTTAGDALTHPEDLPVSQVVVSTNGATPPSSFWGTATTDLKEYEVIIRRLNG